MENNNLDYKMASFWERAAAFIIDALLLLIPLYIFSLIFAFLQTTGYFWLAEFILISTYNTFFVAATGSTIGKRLLRIEVMSNNYQKVGFKKAFIRETIGKYISRLLLGLGFLMALNDKQRRALHDRIAGTYVIKVDSQRNPIIARGEENVKFYERFIFFITAIPIALIIILGVLYGTVARPIKVIGDSMEPNYKNEQTLIVSYPLNIKRGDVVVYRTIVKENRVDFITRVIGLPQDTISIRNEDIYINGEKIDETYLPKGTKTPPGPVLGKTASIKVPADQYFVLVDNRLRKVDSRQLGFLRRENIIGKVFLCALDCSQKTKN